MMGLGGRHRGLREFVATLAALSLAISSAPPAIRAAEPLASGDGLLGRYYSNRDWAGDPYQIRVDPIVDFDFGLPGGAEFSIDWSGSLLVETTGTYTFGLHSDDGSVLSLDGAVVVDNGGEHGPRLVANTIELSAGLHPISIRYFECCAGPAFVRFFWTPPSGTDLVIVPQANLFSQLPAQDTIKPIVVGVPDRGANKNGWYRAPVTIDWQAIDPEPASPPVSDPADTVASIEGTHVYESDPACDSATPPNCDTGKVTLSIDLTKPVVSTTSASAVTGSTFVIGASGGVSCIESAFIEMGPSHRQSLRVPVQDPGPCPSTIQLNGTATLVPGTYDLPIGVSDRAGNQRDATITLTVRPTSHVVILVQGLLSDGLDRSVPCANGYPATELPSEEVVNRAVSLKDAFARLSPLGGVPLEDLTLYVLDYPEASLIAPAATYCYAADPRLGLDRVMLPRYDPIETTTGINLGSPVHRHLRALLELIESLPGEAQVDLVGHSQGAALVAYWLAEASPAERERVHSVITLDGPWDGVTKRGRLILCLGAVVHGLSDECNALGSATWQSWIDLRPGLGDDRVTKAIEKPERTTEVMPVVTLTCDLGCLPNAGMFTTRAGAWLSIVMEADVFGTEGCITDTVIFNHGCFLADEMSLDVVARVVGSKLLDDRLVDRLFAEGDGWKFTTGDKGIMRRGLRGSKPGVATDVRFDVPGSGGREAALAYFTGEFRRVGKELIVDCSVAGSVILDPDTNQEQVFPIEGAALDAFPGTEDNLLVMSDYRRRLCRLPLGALSAGKHVLEVTLSVEPDQAFVLDAAELGPIATGS